ncbi:p-hydroxyphenylacetate 3-hydroxylase oxygenase component [Metapseudomonas otitidis]|jgi:alkylation response protein AidB-like acyl-CoA dehydrogenase|uniref:Acyl-CoA dehydrogenase n=1 Tax=Metapseudomonas otitidis TaxID=319939 RepID=A0A679GBT6_9GAMM|nr:MULTISPECIES: flavin-dependent monooxygenase [Pseudomonas]KIV72203.1 P-hydroxyphenylacetate hydroxylase C2:oxygenase component [Pseudomonas sp. FeS53a]MCP1617722.1 alkylation response protein AidB-like acyl-CoA dehydrogenase [Pseudomonas otitidis]MDU9399087.1 flavin-dependent monooxygenase [Pseudomonas sp. zfem003]MDV3442571.1 flavin-dependent monooxygenase [Pseudomonas otitidis]MEE1894111.1 flavin-dependent monooxygenase [Pseudomonas otitidis]
MKKTNPLLDALREILPAIAANAAQAERDRMVPAENIAMLKGIGMHRAFQPRAYGGLEISLPEFTECVIALAGACASTAWAFSLLCTHSHQLAMFPKQLQDEIWGKDPDATASSSIAPFGRIEEVDGGVRFNGEMGWSSGCDHAEWAIVGCRRQNAEGELVYCFAVLPRSDYEIRDDWFAAGMRGSGTKTLVIKDAFVPNHRIQAAKDMMEGRSAGFGLYPDSKIFYTPYRPYFASGFASISLGIAERMLEAFKEKTRNRVRAYTGASVGTATPALMRLAESTHQVAAARAFLEKTWQDHAAHGERHEYPSRETLAYWRTNQAYAVKMCIQAVDRLFEAAGGTAWFEGNEMQRLFRDSHMTGAHAYTDYDVCAQILGRELMGLEPDPSMV